MSQSDKICWWLPAWREKNTPSSSSTLLANPQQDTKCSILWAGEVTWTSLPSLERGTCSSIFHITFVHSWAFCCGVSDLELHDHFTLYDSRYVFWPLIVMAIMSHLVPDAADVEDNSFVQLPRLLDDERVRRLGLKLLQYLSKMTNKNVLKRKIREDGGYFETELHLCKKRSARVGRSVVPKTKTKLSFILKKARRMWLLLENAKQETRIIRIASVTITSPGIMMMGRNLSQAQDHFWGISQKPLPSLPRLFFTSLPPPRFVRRSQRFSPKQRLCSPSAQRPLWKLQSELAVGMIIMKVSKSFLAIAIVIIVLLMIIRMIETTSPANGDSNVRRRNISSDCCSPKNKRKFNRQFCCTLERKNTKNVHVKNLNNAMFM